MVLNANAQRDVGNDWHPQLTTDGRGTWVAIWSTDEPQVGTIGFGDYIVVARSTNQGVTWTEPVPMSTSSVFDEASSNFPQLSTDKSGVLIATWISDTTLGGTIGRDLDILIVRSTDGGANWSMPRALNTAARSDGMTDNEPQLASDGSGNWVAVWKSYQTIIGTVELEFGTVTYPDYDIQVARSADDGLTWTAPVALNPVGGNNGVLDHQPRIATDGRGTWMATWMSDDSALDAIQTSNDILVARSTDNGINWSVPERLYGTGETELGNGFFPQLATDGGRSWFVVWDAIDTIDGRFGKDSENLMVS
jgi:Neuraminidase (sialidase)